MKVFKVVVTGPESTGKTSLAKMLASHFNTVWMPEYARDYISGLQRNYEYDDIEIIAKEQVRRGNHYLSLAKDFLFYDTYLIITKVWFRVLYGRYPEWIDTAIQKSEIDLFLVCNTDIPWVPDPLRENGGQMRRVLLEMYINEINLYGIPWKLVSGKDERRTSVAVDILRNHFNQEYSGLK